MKIWRCWTMQWWPRIFAIVTESFTPKPIANRKLKKLMCSKPSTNLHPGTPTIKFWKLPNQSQKIWVLDYSAVHVVPWRLKIRTKNSQRLSKPNNWSCFYKNITVLRILRICSRGDLKKAKILLTKWNFNKSKTVSITAPFRKSPTSKSLTSFQIK